MRERVRKELGTKSSGGRMVLEGERGHDEGGSSQPLKGSEWETLEGVEEASGVSVGVACRVVVWIVCMEYKKARSRF